MADSRERPISIAMLALGGQGGGVLTGWMVSTAEANGYIAQSTYVAGVAQRTGATVYCVELFPKSSLDNAGRMPVFTPYPIPGDVDLVIAGEMAETARAIEKGFVTPNISTLIASSHRVYSMPEKEALGDGIVDLSPLTDIATKASKSFICFDMQAAADATGSIISSVILGAIAASGALPFPREAFETTIRQTGKAVDENLRGFAAGFDGAAMPAAAAEAVEMETAEATGPNGQALAKRIEQNLPPSVQNMALHGALRTLEYQDARYASQYLDRIETLAGVDSESGNYALTTEVARQLALQMCYEDTIRVAELKTRGTRFERIRDHVAAASDQPVRVIEYFHPRVEEIADTLPTSLGNWLINSQWARKFSARFLSKGKNITTTNLSGFLLLHLLAKFRRFRRGTYRFGIQQRLIDDWLERVSAHVDSDYDYALSIAHCIEIVKGYGDTYERGLTRYRATLDTVRKLPDDRRGDAVRQLHRAALADEQGQVFADTLASLKAAA
ncbi:MAG: indolepyruvate oxidoreductase subunit beta family protein [Woeseiaceae bacterium]